MARIEAEYLRTNVTVGQFLSYVRANLRKRGLNEWADGIDYENFINGDWSCKVDHEELNDEAFTQLGVAYEEVRDLPYNKMSYQRKANGAVSNEIMEFVFDDESTGHGYYYAVDCVDEADSVESTTDEAAAAESETEAENESVESVESVDNGETNSCGEIALGAIAREFAGQQKYYDEKWSHDHPDTNDCIVQYWYSWKDGGGVRHNDCVEIWLSDACHMAGVDFDVVDDGDIEGRMIEEMVDRGYTVDDDNEIVIDDDADEYAICEEMDEVRSELWEQAQNEAEQARDELCLHEDIGEPWFRELCEEMLAKVNATLAE